MSFYWGKATMTTLLLRVFSSGRTSLLIALAMMPAIAIACDTADLSKTQVSAYIRNLGAQVKASPNAPEGKAAMEELIEILKTDDSSFARCQVCYALDSLGSLSTPAVPTLMEVAESDNATIRKAAAIRGLRNIGPPAAEAVDLLIEIVDSANSRKESSLLRILYAIEGLGKYRRSGSKGDSRS